MAAMATNCQYIVHPAGQPARTYETVDAAARALLDHGSVEPVSVVMMSASGHTRARPLRSTELRSLGHAVTRARQRPPRLTDAAVERLAQALDNLPPEAA